MRSRSFVAVVASLALALALVAGTYAYDRARYDRLAQGITVGGVPIGGLTAAQAQARLDRDLLGRLRAPIVVDHANKSWRLSAREARIAVDLQATIDQALSRTRAGGILRRTARNLTSGRISANIEPRVSFSKPAVVRLLDAVRRGIERPARDARLEFTSARLSVSDGREGLEVRASELHRAIRAAIVSPTAARRLVAHTRKMQPKVTQRRLAKANPVVLIADRVNFKLRVYRKLKLDKSYSIAVGAVGHATPAGLYSIANKAVNPAWHVPDSPWAGDLAGKVIPGGVPENPIKSRWLGIFDGVGIHGTSDRASIGSNASHGCLRMLIEDVEDLYPRVPIGAPIYIA